jgi:hypothetical protein
MKLYTPTLVTWGMMVDLIDYELIPRADIRNLVKLRFCNAYSSYNHLELF